MRVLKAVNITVPSSVTSIEKRSFVLKSGTDLINIFVDKNNEFFSDNNGVLFNKQQTSLIKYPEGRWETNYTIPDTVVSINDEAFDCCYNIESIIIPDNVKSIGWEVYHNCANLKALYIYNDNINMDDSPTGLGF